MGRTKQAGNSNVSMGAAVEVGKEKAPRKPRKSAQMRVVPWDLIKDLPAVESVKAGIRAMDGNPVGTYAVVTVRAVQDIAQGTFNRKAAL